MVRQVQDCFGKPACFNTALAVCRDLILLSTLKCSLVIGEYQME